MTYLTPNNNVAPVNSRVNPIRGISFIEPIGPFISGNRNRRRSFKKFSNYKWASGKHPHVTATLSDWTHNGAMYRFPLRKNAVKNCRARNRRGRAVAAAL